VLPQNECNIRNNKKTKKLLTEEVIRPTGFDSIQPSISIEHAVEKFNELVEKEVRHRLVLERVERESNKSFRLPESIALKLTACEWFRANYSSKEVLGGANESVLLAFNPTLGNRSIKGSERSVA
jgi:hypothetical protein